MKEKIIIFTDGASKGNPGPAGWGSIVVYGEKVRELGGREQSSTNNRMELTAVIEALSFLSGLKLQVPSSVVIYTDSSYVINGITKWLAGWQANGWMTKKKEQILNRDLWEKLAELIGAFEIEWKYVGGHIGIAGNDRADRIASNSADGMKVELYDGLLEKYGIDILNINFDESMQKAKSASRNRSKITAYSYVSEVGGVVQVHKTWAECEARVKGKRARFKKAISPEEESLTISEFSS